MRFNIYTFEFPLRYFDSASMMHIYYRYDRQVMNKLSLFSAGVEVKLFDVIPAFLMKESYSVL